MGLLSSHSLVVVLGWSLYTNGCYNMIFVFVPGLVAELVGSVVGVQLVEFGVAKKHSLKLPYQSSPLGRCIH